jgi:hypothetical protein
VNERDRNSATRTPEDQGGGEADLRITQDIRKAIMGRNDLSMTAENVKVITADGVVTLRGPVKSDDERSTIERLARDVAGVRRVDNQLEVIEEQGTQGSQGTQRQPSNNQRQQGSSQQGSRNPRGSNNQGTDQQNYGR